MATRRQVKKTTTKAADVNNQEVKEVKKAVEQTVKDVKETAKETAKEIKKTVEEKAPETAKKVEKEVKKTASKVKKTVAAKKEIKTDIVLQYGEKEVNTKEMIAAVKKEWTKSKHKVADIKSIELYVKPEDYAVYYVINGDTTGKIWL